MSIFLSTPVVTSGGGGVQQVNSGNGISVNNSNPAQPIVSNNGVISVSSNANSQNFNDIYIDTANPNQPVFYKSSPWARFYASQPDQFALGIGTPTPLILTGTWDDSTQQINFNAGAFNVDIAEGVYYFDYKIAVSNFGVANSDFSCAIEINGILDNLSPQYYNVQLGTTNINASFIVQNNTGGYAPVNLLWATNEPASTYIQQSFPSAFGTNQYQATLSIFQITATNFQQ